MGTIALLVFLGSLALGLISLVVLAYSALSIYRTARYGYKDLQPWLKLYQEYMLNLQDSLKIMEKRAQNITEIGLQMRESVDDIQDAVEEMRSHPMVRASRVLGRFRRS
jgi:hypothetical protein